MIGLRGRIYSIKEGLGPSFIFFYTRLTLNVARFSL